MPVHKRRARYTVAAARPSGRDRGRRPSNDRRSQSSRPTRRTVLAAIDALGLRDYCNLDVPTGLRLLVDRVPERYAVIDAGTNSIKFHVAELDADGRGPWRTVVDRAVVTRLGEGLEATGEIGAEPLERTAQAISEMADEARGLDARAIARGRHGGIADGWQPGRGRRDGSGTLPGCHARRHLGEDEGRLAYLAVATGIGLGDGAIVVFDTGGGSSQFTFGHGADRR